MNELCYLCGQIIEGSGCYNSGMGVHYHLTCPMTTPPPPLHWRTEPPDRPGWWLRYYFRWGGDLHLHNLEFKDLEVWQNRSGYDYWFGPIEKPENGQ